MKKINIKRHKTISKKRIAAFGLCIALQANTANLYCAKSPYKAKAKPLPQLTKKTLPKKLVEEVENKKVLIPSDRPSINTPISSIDTPASVSNNTSPSYNIYKPKPTPSFSSANMSSPSGSSTMTSSSYSTPNPLPKVVPSSSSNVIPQPNGILNFSGNIPVPPPVPSTALDIPVPPVPPPMPSTALDIPVPPVPPPSDATVTIPFPHGRSQLAACSDTMPDEACIQKPSLKKRQALVYHSELDQAIRNELDQAIRKRRAMIEPDDEKEDHQKQDDRPIKQAAVSANRQGDKPSDANKAIKLAATAYVPNPTNYRHIKLKVVQNTSVKGPAQLRSTASVAYHPRPEVLNELTQKEPVLVDILRGPFAKMAVVEASNDHEANKDAGSDSEWVD